MSISDFTLLKELGSGSYGNVFKAVKKDDHQTYAIKQVKLAGMDRKDRENAVNEVRLLASIHIAHVIKFKDTFVDDAKGILYLVMEYADGGDIASQIKTHKKNGTYFPEAIIWKAAFELLSGLDKLHENKIIHRDIKPANVFVVDSVYKLGDLNVSKATENGLAHTQIGTPYYTAPEIWGNETYGSPCDLWSLGCLLYEMATLQPPFVGKDFAGLYNKIKTGVYAPISPIKYSKELAAFLKKMIVLSPRQRCTAEQLLHIAKFEDLKESQTFSEEEINLLKTIQYPKSLKHIHDKLPASDYLPPKKSKRTENVKFQDNQNYHNNRSYKDIQSEKLISHKSEKILQKHAFLPQIGERRPSIDRLRDKEPREIKRLFSPIVNEMRPPNIVSEKQIGGLRKRGIF